MLYVLENEQISIESAEAQSSATAEESTEAQSSAAAEESTEAQSSAVAEESTEAQSSAVAEESTEAQSSAATEESATSTESVISDGDTTESVEITEEPKEWPEGGSEAFTNHALPSLVFGMLGIFLVLGLIAVATMALNKLFPGKKDN